jgi:hypothetical protein
VILQADCWNKTSFVPALFPAPAWPENLPGPKFQVRPKCTKTPKSNGRFQIFPAAPISGRSNKIGSKCVRVWLEPRRTTNFPPRPRPRANFGMVRAAGRARAPRRDVAVAADAVRARALWVGMG